MWDKQQIQSLKREALPYIEDTIIGEHLAALNRHLNSFDSQMLVNAKRLAWAEVEREADTIRTKLSEFQVEPADQSTADSAPAAQPTVQAPLPQMPQRVWAPEVRYDAESDLFTSTMPKMVKLATRVMQELGYRIVETDWGKGVVTVMFVAGITAQSKRGIMCSLNIETAGDDLFSVVDADRHHSDEGRKPLTAAAIEARAHVMLAINRMQQLSS